MIKIRTEERIILNDIYKSRKQKSFTARELRDLGFNHVDTMCRLHSMGYITPVATHVGGIREWRLTDKAVDKLLGRVRSHAKKKRQFQAVKRPV